MRGLRLSHLSRARLMRRVRREEVARAVAETLASLVDGGGCPHTSPLVGFSSLQCSESLDNRGNSAKVPKKVGEQHYAAGALDEKRLRSLAAKRDGVDPAGEGSGGVAARRSAAF